MNDYYNQYGQNQNQQPQFVTNSSADEMDALIEGGNDQTLNKPKFDEKRYLDTRLKDGMEKRSVRIRLLPITATSSKMFAQAKTHSLKVPKQIAASGFKSYVCLDDPNIPGYDPNVRCPICAKSRELFNKAREYNPKDINEKVEALTLQADQYEAAGEINGANQIRQQIPQIQAKVDPVMSKAIFKEACALKSKTTYYSRVIDRDKENEGVKWWRFNENTDHDGIYDHLLNLYTQLRGEMKAAGIDDRYNVFDLNNGRDFVLNLAQKTETGANGQMRNRTKIQISVASMNSPLTNNITLGNQWLTDPMVWSDCYAIKSADYLAAVVEGKIPKMDKTTGKWIGIEPYGTGVQQTAETVQQTQQAVDAAYTNGQYYTRPVDQQQDIPF